jgi:hypothetical protein
VVGKPTHTHGDIYFRKSISQETAIATTTDLPLPGLTLVAMLFLRPSLGAYPRLGAYPPALPFREGSPMRMDVGMCFQKRKFEELHDVQSPAIRRK